MAYKLTDFNMSRVLKKSKTWEKNRFEKDPNRLSRNEKYLIEIKDLWVD